MSKRDKFSSISAGLGEALDKMEPAAATAAPRTAPAQLMAFRNEMASYEDKIAALEADLADAKRTEIPLGVIDPNPWQPRTYFDSKEIQDLASSIAEVGLIQPVIVRRVQSLDTGPNNESVQSLDTRYQLVAGERRLRAHRLLGKEDIKAIIIDASNEDMALMSLVENIDRQDLADYEIAKAIRRAEKEFPNRKHMAAALGMERSDLYRYLAFDDLPVEVLADLESTPKLLGRAAASSVQVILKKYGQQGSECVSKLWTRVKAGDLDQGKFASAVESMITKGHTVRTDRDIKKLFVGKEQAGSITRDASSLTIKIKSAALNGEQEEKLRTFVEGLLKP